jgi:hypothetical protein
MSATRYVVVVNQSGDDGYATRVFGVFHDAATADSFVMAVNERLGAAEDATVTPDNSMGEMYGRAYKRVINSASASKKAVEYAMGQS